MMRKLPIRLLLLLWAAALGAPGQQVVDRILVRIDGDIITLSEARELAAYQQLIEERSLDRRQILNQLIDQWILNREAQAARLPMPDADQVNAELEELEKKFPSRQAYRERLRELGLTPDAMRRLVERQLYLMRFLDYDFRPTVQVEREQIENYYRTELSPRLAARGQPVPPLEAVERQIRELLIQQQISERAKRWLERTRSQLRIEFVEDGGTR